MSEGPPECTCREEWNALNGNHEMGCPCLVEEADQDGLWEAAHALLEALKHVDVEGEAGRVEDLDEAEDDLTNAVARVTP